MFPGFYEEIHEEFREVVREFVTREVSPHYQQWDAAVSYTHLTLPTNREV